MRLTFLDKIEEDGATCLLCRTTLRDYVSSLEDDFQDYFVQRSIVTNRFLDQLWETVSRKRHIPTIVLVVNDQELNLQTGEQFQIGSEIKILDGLQRSARLNAIWKTLVFLETEFVDDPGLSGARLARKNSSRLKELGCAPSLFTKMLSTKRNQQQGESLYDYFEENFIWLEVWVGLTEAEQVKKMLILNAGHKTVNIKHQIELLFIEYLPFLQKAIPNAKVYRERDVSSQSYSKNRRPGDFHFAHLISAFESLNSAKPITTNSEFSAAKSFASSDETDSDELSSVDLETMQQFALTISKLDTRLSDKTGVTWLGREVVLVGLFAAIGKYAKDNYEPPLSGLKHFDEHLDNYVGSLNLADFEEFRNSLDLSKVNIGAKNKKAVYEATLEFLEAPMLEDFDWQRHFEG